jgi:hypothetical protein
MPCDGSSAANHHLEKSCAAAGMAERSLSKKTKTRFRAAAGAGMA